MMVLLLLCVEQVYIDDLEDLLDEFMDSLNTEIGDGSIEEVCLLELFALKFRCQFVGSNVSTKSNIFSIFKKF